MNSQLSKEGGTESNPPTPAGNEYRQAVIRLAIGSSLLSSLLLLAFWSLDSAPSGSVVATTVALLFLLPLALLISVAHRPGRYPGRRYIGLVFDIASLTTVIYLGDKILFPLCIAYSWIIFDYAKRFGIRFLYPAAAASFLSFGSLLLISDFWQINSGPGLVFLSFIALLPLYLRNFVPFDEKTSLTAPEATDSEPSNTEVCENDEALAVNHKMDSANLPEKKILLVSNDIEDRHSIQRQLAMWGTQSTLTGNAAHAFYELIAAAKSGNPYHTIIVDQGHLGMDAAQFASALRCEPTLQSLYLIHVGPGSQGLQGDRLLAAGYTKLLSTPLNKTFLFNALHNTYTQPEPSGQVVRLIDRYTCEISDQPLSILVADRSFGVRQRIRSILQRAGHRVFMVNNGARVLDALDSHRFDLAIVSLDLKEITGLEVFKLYRFTRVDKQWVPFILLLEEPTKELLKRCGDAGINATINQSADSRRYLATIDKVLRESREETGSNFSVGSLSSSTHAGSALKNDGALDTSRLLEIEKLGGGVRFLSDLIDSFNRDNRRILTQMKEAANDAGPKRFRDLGHAIKDAAGSLGALKLYQLGTAASRLSDKEFHESAATLVQEITECCRTSNNALHSDLRGQTPTESDSLGD